MIIKVECTAREADAMVLENIFGVEHPFSTCEWCQSDASRARPHVPFYSRDRIEALKLRDAIGKRYGAWSLHMHNGDGGVMYQFLLYEHWENPTTHLFTMAETEEMAIVKTVLLSAGIEVTIKEKAVERPIEPVH